MATTLNLKKTIANRLNALLSTGPKTSEGKKASRQNARTHGLSKVGTCLPAEMAEEIERRKGSWAGDYRPEGEAQEWAFGRLCAESVRLEFCEARIVAARGERAERASESWDDDRAAGVAEQGARLGARPEVVQPRLLQSKHGVLWMLERWDEVADRLERHDRWSADDWDLALDLLGVPRAGRNESGPWDLHPEDPSAGPGLELISRCVAALRQRLDDVLIDRDARAQADAALGLDADEPPAIRLLERYAADARRRFSSHLNELRRLQSESAANPAARQPIPAPIPGGPPSPRPNRSAASRLSPAGASPPPQEPARPPDAVRAASPEVAASSAREIPGTATQFPAGTSAKATSPARQPGGSLRETVRARLVAGSPKLNRRARRAQAAAARRS